MFEPKGYLIKSGYIGVLPDGTKMLFPTEEDYRSYISEIEKEDD